MTSSNWDGESHRTHWLAGYCWITHTRLWKPRYTSVDGKHAALLPRH